MYSKKFSLVLVRHGQTTHNKTKTIQGQLDTQLTELGRDQARLLRDYLEKTGEKFDKVYASDLTRAYETCQIVCNEKYTIHKDKLLRERSFGVLQGSPLDDLRSEAYKAGFDDSDFTQFRPEGGETMGEVLARIEKFCKEELYPKAKEDEKILIVTHGGVIREFFKYFKSTHGCELTNEDMRISPNTGVNRFKIYLKENDTPRVFIEGLHEIPHLSDEAKNEALSEEQLNDSTMKKKEKQEVEYAV